MHNFKGGTMENGCLYLVPTPIGNLKDMTFRAVEVLNNVSRIYAEDTRTSRHLLNHYSIETACYSYHKFNEKKRIDEIISVLKSGLSVAIISDAGSPGISDPSLYIVQACIQEQINVCPLPGASALIPAVTGSGFDVSQFLMLGFLPTKKTDLDRLLKTLETFPYPFVIYESPHRIMDTLQCLYDALGDRKICIARELSKMYESWYRGSLNILTQQPDLIKVKGEFVIVVQSAEQKEFKEEYIIKSIENYGDQYSTKELAKILADEYNVSKKTMYELLLNLRKPKGYKDED